MHEGDEATDKSFKDMTETMSSVPGGGPVGSET